MLRAPCRAVPGGNLLVISACEMAAAGHSVHCCANYPAVKRASISVSTAPNKTQSYDRGTATAAARRGEHRNHANKQ